MACSLSPLERVHIIRCMTNVICHNSVTKLRYHQTIPILSSFTMYDGLTFFFTVMATNFEVSPEWWVFWRHYGQLLNTITDPWNIAVEAHSRGVLPRDWIGVVGGPPVQMTTVLLSAVSERVKENSQVFYQFVELLKVHPSLILLANLMEQNCSKLCLYIWFVLK